MLRQPALYAYFPPPVIVIGFSSEFLRSRKSSRSSGIGAGAKSHARRRRAALRHAYRTGRPMPIRSLRIGCHDHYCPSRFAHHCRITEQSPPSYHRHLHIFSLHLAALQSQRGFSVYAITHHHHHSTTDRTTHQHLACQLPCCRRVGANNGSVVVGPGGDAASAGRCMPLAAAWCHVSLFNGDHGGECGEGGA